mmetsp:Transcript_17762/g.26316  ORF Transcript_17762/g.26316 Transcript_17762/m.26316 type:complete len:228 (+) Transcript_17762:21-704(+)
MSIIYQQKVLKLVIEPIIIVLARSWSCTLVHIFHNRIGNGLDLFLFGCVVIRISIRIFIQPIQGLLNLVLQLFLVGLTDFISHSLLRVIQHVFKVVEITFKAVFGIDSPLHLLILICVLFSLTHHSVDLLLTQPALIGSDGDFFSFASAFVLRTNLQYTICIDLKGDFDLRDTTRSRWDPREVEFTQNMVILGHRSFALEHLDQDCGLVVLVGGERLTLFSRNWRVS